MLLLLTQTALAGWTQPQGAHYAKVGVRGIVGNRAMLAEGITIATVDQEVEVEPLQDWALQLYGEYGISDDWTGVIQASPVGFSRYGDRSTVYTGQLKLGIRHGLMTGTHNLAVQVDVGYTPPLGQEDLSAGSLLPELVFVPIESHVEAGGQLQYGAGFGHNWVSLAAGAAWLSTLDPIAMGGFSLGRTFPKRGNRLDLHIPFRIPFAPLREPANFAGTGDTRYIGIGIGYTFTFGDGWGVQTSGEAVLVGAANIGAPTIPLYLEHKGG